MSTWRSELKNTAFAVSLVAYNLIPPQDTAMLREKAQWVQNAAAELLTDSLFLRDGFDELVLQTTQYSSVVNAHYLL